MKISGTFVAHGSAIPVDIGFIPDYIEAFELTSDPEVVYRWYRCLYDKASTFMYGIADDGAGALSDCGSANGGFIPYEGRKTPQVLVESPVPETGDLAVPCFNYAYQIANSVTPTARSATVIGTMVRPDTANGYVYECTTTTGACAAEPTWPTTPGGTVTDSASNVWTCREENIALTGGMGFQVGSTLSVNSDIWVFKAENHDRHGDMGDADGQDPVKLPLR